MKKFLLMVFLVILFVVEVSAIDYKLMGGISLSRTKAQFAEEIFDFVSYGIGFLIGGGIEFTLSKNLSIELDCLYFQKRSVYKIYDWDLEEFRELVDKIDEISFPVLVKFKHLFNSPFFLLGGGEFAIFDYGAVFGVGIEVKGPPISFVEIRYHIGDKANAIALVLAFSP